MPMGGILTQRRHDPGNREIGGDADGVDLQVDVAYVRQCTVIITCNGAVKWVLWGIVYTLLDW